MCARSMHGVCHGRPIATVNNGAIVVAIPHDQAVWEVSDRIVTITPGGRLRCHSETPRRR